MASLKLKLQGQWELREGASREFLKRLRPVSYSIEFEIKGLPKITTNGPQGSWRAKAGNARVWKNHVVTAIVLAKKPLPPERLKCARCTFIRFSAFQPDDDNLRASFKPVRDGLILAGVMANDRPENMPDPIYRWEKCPRNAGRIFVRVEEIHQYSDKREFSPVDFL